MTGSTTARTTLDLTAEIVSAHVRYNEVPPDSLPALIREVYRALDGVAAGSVAGTSKPDKPQPAVPIKRSVFADYILCLEDGKKLKTLKRHLHTSHQMSIEQYRERWDLPSDYPMVAQASAKLRSSLAKKTGLGQKYGDRGGEIDA